MRASNRTLTVPVGYTRSRRNLPVEVMTSGKAGKMIPLAYVPLLREDSLSGVLKVTTEMMETREIIANRVVGRIMAYLVPWLAMERFGGSRDLFDKSYWGEPLQEGDDVVPFFETHEMGAHGSKAVYKALGLHAGVTQDVNTMPLEAYNAIWNFRARNRSKAITLRDPLDASLARAFWMPGRFEHIVTDWDQAMMDGQVPLNVIGSQLPVKGFGKANSYFDPAGATGVREAGGDVRDYEYAMSVDDGAANNRFYVEGGADGFPKIFAEMMDNGITVSLSSIERAKKMRGFAKVRERYTGHSDDTGKDDWIISQLMNGMRIPEQHLKNPVLLADKMVTFGQSKRYAADGANLTLSAVSGGASVNLPVGYGNVNVGGMLMVVAEYYPTQLFERQADPFFHINGAVGAEQLPLAMNDVLDDEPVDIVTNGEVDTAHSDPDTVFGYAPMNWKWSTMGPRMGGKYYRPSVDAGTDTDRQRFWAAETADPTLSEDFYLVPADLHQKPFVNLEADPFEIGVSGVVTIRGNTQFGGQLHEAEDNYDTIDVDTRRDKIEKDE